ncbi:hypothetical protein JCM8097_001523 [Rhodosporidiobolus ruineniae]
MSNAYIVALKTDSDVSVQDELSSLVESKGGNIKHRYDSKVIKGFAGSFSEDVKVEIEKHPAVKYVEPDGAVSTQ